MYPSACQRGPSARPQPEVSKVGSVDSNMSDRFSAIVHLLDFQLLGFQTCGLGKYTRMYDVVYMSLTGFKKMFDSYQNPF